MQSWDAGFIFPSTRGFQGRLCSFLLSLGTSVLRALGVGQGPEQVPSQRDASSPRGSGGDISVPPWLLLPTRLAFQDIHPSWFPRWRQLQRRPQRSYSRDGFGLSGPVF